ncbi:MAG: ABC transporter substrate-binding protein [Sulfolobales archaeon]
MRTSYVKILSTTLLISIVFVSLISAFITTNISYAQTSEINAVTYDKWLTRCDRYGGTIKIAFPSEPNTLNTIAAGSTWEILILESVYDRLFRWINGTLTYELAKSVEYSPDHLVLTIKIREGVKWHDGSELTADDVAFTINAYANSSWAYLYSYFTSVANATAVDKYTVKVYFKKPDAGFIYTALAGANIIPKKIWERLYASKGDALAKYSPKIPDELIGSGPFKLVEWVPTQYIRLVANKDYWLGRPCVDEMIIVFITEAQAALLAVQRGDVDAYVGWVTPEAVPQLLSTPNVALHVFVSDTFYHWGLNNLVYPLNISEFRRALAFAIDRQAIVNQVLMGYGIVGSPGVVPPVGPNAQWYNPNVQNAYYYDPKKAAEILDKLGFRDVDGDGWRELPNGSKFQIEIYAPSYDIVRVRAAQMIADWLAKIPGGGIKAVPRAADWTAVWPMIREAKVDSWLLGSGPDNYISWLFFRFHSRPQGAGNWVRFSDPEVDKLTEELLTTFDPVKVKEIAYRIQELIAEKVPIITLYYRKLIEPYRTDKFENWFRDPTTDIYNRITYLRVQLKSGGVPAVTQTQIIRETVTSPVSIIQPTATVTVAQTVPTVAAAATTPTAPTGISETVLYVVIGVVVLLVILLAVFLLKRK